MSEALKAFAELLVEVFREAGESRPIRYDHNSFKLFVPGEDRAFWIGNLFIEAVQTAAEDWDGFRANAWEVWSTVQAELSEPPHWVPEFFRPMRDETHPLSYRVEQIPGERFWAVVPPFDERCASECFDLVDAYRVWFSDQMQRACLKHLRNIYHWLTSGQVTEDELRVLSELRRLWRCGMLVARGDDTRLEHELSWLGRTAELPPMLAKVLRMLPERFASLESAVNAFRHLRNHGPQK